MFSVITLVGLHIVTFLNNILTFFWTLWVSTLESTKNSSNVAFKYRLEIGISLLLFLSGIPFSEFQSEVYTGGDITYECAASPVIQFFQSLGYTLARTPLSFWAPKQNDLVLYLEDSIKDTYYSLIAIDDIASVEGIVDLISIIWEEIKVFLTAVLSRPDLQIPYVSEILLDIETAAFCFVDAAGSVGSSILELNILAQNCEVCSLQVDVDPNKKCPISQGATAFYIPEGIFPAPNCSQCTDPVNDVLTCFGNVIDLASLKHYHDTIFDVVDSISCIINNIFIPPLYIIQGLVTGCVTSSIGDVIKSWFLSMINCFNGFIQAISGNQDATFFDLLLTYIAPFIESVVNDINALITCEKDPIFKSCLQSWTNNTACSSNTVCGACKTNSNGAITQGINTCFSYNIKCVENITLFQPISPVINIIPWVMLGVDYVVCPFRSIAYCFSSAYRNANCDNTTNNFAMISCEFDCISVNVPIIKVISNLLSAIFNFIGDTITTIQNDISWVQMQFTTIWTDISDLPDEIWDYIKGKIKLKKDQDSQQFPYNQSEGYADDFQTEYDNTRLFDNYVIPPKWFRNGTYNHFPSYFPPPNITVTFKYNPDDYQGSSFARNLSEIDSETPLARRYWEIQDEMELFKIEHNATSFLDALYNYVSDSISNTTTYSILQSFNNDFSAWKKRHYVDSTSDSISIVDKRSNFEETLRNITKNSELEEIYLRHVNAFLYNFEIFKSDFYSNSKRHQVKECQDCSGRASILKSRRNKRSETQNYVSVYNPITSISLHTPIQYVRETTDFIKSKKDFIERLKSKSKVFQNIWDILDRNFAIEINPTFQRIHMAFTALKTGDSENFIKYVNGDKGYLIHKGFVSISTYNMEMKKRTDSSVGSIYNVLTKRFDPMKGAKEKKYGPFLSAQTDMSSLRTLYEIVKNETYEVHRLKVQKDFLRRQAIREDNENQISNPKRVKRDVNSIDTVDYNQVIVNFIDDIISDVKGIKTSGLSDKVSDLKNVFEDYNYSSLDQRIENSIKEYFTVTYPQDVDGTNQVNPWAFPLIPTDILSALQVEPNSNIPLQIPWPSEFIIQDCVKIYNGNSDLFTFKKNNDCENRSSKYCPTCDYCPREYGNECKDMGFRDALDSFLFLIAAIPRFVDTIYEDGINIKNMTPYIIAAELPIIVSIFTLASIIILPVVWFLTYLALYTLSYIFNGILPYGFTILVSTSFVLIFGSQLQSQFVLVFTLLSIFSGSWILFQFIPFPNLALYLNFINYLVISLDYTDQYVGFLVDTSELRFRIERFNYDPNTDIPYIDKYCFMWTYGNIFLGLFGLVPAFVITNYTANYTFDMLLFVVSIIQQAFQLIKDITSIRSLDLQERLQGEKTLMKSRFSEMKQNIVNRFNGTPSSSPNSIVVSNDLESGSPHSLRFTPSVGEEMLPKIRGRATKKD